MQVLTDFVLRHPASIAEAAELLAGPGARALAGGTDLIANMRHGLERPKMLVDLSAIAEMGALRWAGAGVTIGANVTIACLARDTRIIGELPAVAQAARSIAGPGHRSAATVGGNLCLDTRCVYYNQSEAWRRSNGYCLKRMGDVCHVAPQGKHCHAAYSGDLAPALLSLDAEVEIAMPRSTRRAPLAELYRDDGARHLNLERGEFVTAVHLPAPLPGTRMAYRKSRARGAIDFPLAGVAVALAASAGRIEFLRVALTGTNTRPLLVDGTREFSGQMIGGALLEKLGKLVQNQVSPMRTTVTASNYRRQVASALAQRLVKELGLAT
ncbi:MAG: 4-hydroxybenzoyl-CoA reductase subunit beta [Betaproteobacteria bacterium]|nr:4-hydroxybenzoyl-CoA reductase subunit beta [Betaproteobacteria bacterium]